ncbi:hypothetical protein F4703DRAFT_1796143 [Phycomyces blakesleeanus]
MYTKGFINLEILLRLPSPTEEECEYLFTLWSYDNFLEYSHNRPMPDDDKISNTLLLVQNILFLKRTSFKHNSQNSYENKNPPVVHRIYEKKGPYVIRLTIEINNNLKSPSERVFKIPSRWVLYYLRRDSRPERKATPRSTLEQEPLSVRSSLSMVTPLNTISIFDLVPQNPSVGISVQEEGDKVQEIITSTEEWETTSSKAALKRKLTDILEADILSKERSDYSSKKRRRLD